MGAPKDSFLTKISNKWFAKRNAAAQQQLWELCAYGVPSTHTGDKALHVRINDAVAKGAKLDVQNADGDTPLMLLCRRALTQEAITLLELGADIRFTNNKGETAFIAAASAGDGYLVSRLTARGADPRSTDAQGRNAAYLMVHAVSDFKDNFNKSNQLTGLTELLDSGLALDDGLKMAIYHHKKHLLGAAPEVQQIHALASASAEGNAEGVKLLLDLGIEPDAPAALRDDTPLCLGTATGNVEMMDALLDAGANIDLKSPKTHRTPVQTAVRHGQREAFALLLEKGAAIDGKMELLELARDSGKQGIMRDVYDALVERGIMKTEVSVAKTAMRTIRLKTPGGQ